MPHDTPLISTIVAGLVLAFILGAVANRLRMPPLVGYLVAGIVVGPFTPGFVADTELATQLSELGVILLMFGVGLHFSLKDLLSVRAIAIPGALVQIAAATLLGVGLAISMGWSIGAGLIFGLALSVASTVVLLKALQDRHIVESERGRIAVGWLIVEDIVMILALVLIPALAGVFGGSEVQLHDPFVALIERLTGLHLNIWVILGITLIKIAAFIGFMLVVGRRVIPSILHLTAHTGNRELFRLAVLAIALGVAAGSAYLFGVSLALGAFFAGMILSESELSNRAAQETLPLRDAFAVLFFVAVGMLFDPMILVESPLPVLATVLIIVVGKSAAAYLICIVFRQPVGTSLTISASLAQIGEFSFILAALGVGLGILAPEARDLILAGALISIILNPLIFRVIEAVRPRLEARASARNPGIVRPNRVEPGLTGPSADAAMMSDAVPPADSPVDVRRPSAQTGHTILIGYGRVGTVVAAGLRKQGTPLVVIEDSEKRIAAAHADGFEVIVGNAATLESLNLANIEAAKTLIVAITNAFEAGTAVQQSRKLNGGLTIVARAHSDEEVTYLRELGASQVIMGEREIGLSILGWTNGENAHEVEVERTQASLDAVAAALAIDKLPPRPAEESPSDPTPERLEIPVTRDAVEARIEEIRAAKADAEPMEVEPEVIQEDLPLEEAPRAQRDSVANVLEPIIIDAEVRPLDLPANGEPTDEVVPPVETVRRQRAGQPSSAPGVPYQPKLDGAD